MKKYDVVLLGSGISSFIAALFLAKKGRSVLILEKYIKPGGYMHSFSRFGFHFETGAHYFGALHPGDPFHTLLSYLGLSVEELFVPMAGDGFDVLCFPSAEIKVPRTYEAFAESVSAEFPEERAGIEKFLKEMKQAVTFFPTYSFKLENDEAKLIHYMETPLQFYLDQYLVNPRLKAVFSAHAILHGVKPSEIAFGLHAVMMDSILRGAFGIRGRGDLLVKALRERLEVLGGEVLTKNEVLQLEIGSGGLVRGVRTSHGYFEADSVISSLHPKATFRLVGTELFSPAFNKRWQNLKESEGMLGIYGVFKDIQDYDPHRNYLFYFSDEPAHSLGNSGELEGSPIFLARPDRDGPFSIERGPLQILTRGSYDWFKNWEKDPYGQRSLDYNAHKEEIALKTLESLRFFGRPLRDQVEKFAVSTPLSNLHFNGSEEGSSYGIYHSIAQTGGRSIGPRTHIPNLFLTGQSTLFPGLLGASISGLRTAGHLLGPKQILKELIEFQGGSTVE